MQKITKTDICPATIVTMKKVAGEKEMAKWGSGLYVKNTDATDKSSPRINPSAKATYRKRLKYGPPAEDSARLMTRKR